MRKEKFFPNIDVTHIEKAIELDDKSKELGFWRIESELLIDGILYTVTISDYRNYQEICVYSSKIGRDFYRKYYENDLIEYYYSLSIDEK